MWNIVYFWLKQHKSVCIIIGIIILIQLTDINTKQWLQYNYEGVQNGEYWRLLTAHFVHLGWTHLILNIIALLLILELATIDFTLLYTFRLILFCGVGITLGLLIFSPETTWYVGFSGVLHGLLAVIVWQQICAYQGKVLLVLLIAKLVWEQCYGEFTTVDLIGSTVIIDAHLYGAIMGILQNFSFSLKTNISH
ncbi:MAG: rhombosortase [Candidatus Marithrix sp.]